MPPKPRLHSKNGKPKSFPKSLPSSSQSSTSNAEPTAEDNDRKFEVELLWCIQQLENNLGKSNLNPKQGEEFTNVLRVLKNNNQPNVRKRQLMRQHFGDYRAKMAAEEKIAKKAEKNITIVTPSTSKATFIRKSTLAMGDNSFKFNFNLPLPSSDLEPEQNSNEANRCNRITNNLNKLSFGSSGFKFNFDINGKM